MFIKRIWDRLFKTILIINGIEYDLTEFLDLHPGGQSIIKKYANRDATDTFIKAHNDNKVWKLIDKYRI